MAGAGNVPMFKFWYERIVKQCWTCDLEKANMDGRNLWSIAGLAHEEEDRPSCNLEIKKMVQHLAKLKYMVPAGLATHSGANQGKRKRIKDGKEEVQDTLAPQVFQAASSSSRRPASPPRSRRKVTGAYSSDSSEHTSSRSRRKVTRGACSSDSSQAR